MAHDLIHQVSSRNWSRESCSDLGGVQQEPPVDLNKPRKSPVLEKILVGLVLGSLGGAALVEVLLFFNWYSTRKEK